MALLKCEYVRVGGRVFTPDGSLFRKFESINAAKRWSRMEQGASGMGNGRVRVQSKLNVALLQK